METNEMNVVFLITGSSKGTCDWRIRMESWTMHSVKIWYVA